MTLPELYEQQQRELEQYKALREQVWAKLYQEQQGVIGAFGKDNLPEELQKRLDEQIFNHHKEWATNTGERYQHMQQHHEKQREALIGLPTPKHQVITTDPKQESKTEANSNKLSEK